jgi:hypothetical protein
MSDMSNPASPSPSWQTDDLPRTPGPRTPSDDEINKCAEEVAEDMYDREMANEADQVVDTAAGSIPDFGDEVGHDSDNETIAGLARRLERERKAAPLRLNGGGEMVRLRKRR